MFFHLCFFHGFSCVFECIFMFFHFFKNFNFSLNSSSICISCSVKTAIIEISDIITNIFDFTVTQSLINRVSLISLNTSSFVYIQNITITENYQINSSQTSAFFLSSDSKNECIFMISQLLIKNNTGSKINIPIYLYTLI